MSNQAIHNLLNLVGPMLPPELRKSIGQEEVATMALMGLAEMTPDDRLEEGLRYIVTHSVPYLHMAPYLTTEEAFQAFAEALIIATIGGGMAKKKNIPPPLLVNSMFRTRFTDPAAEQFITEVLPLEKKMWGALGITLKEKDEAERAMKEDVTC